MSNTRRIGTFTMCLVLVCVVPVGVILADELPDVGSVGISALMQSSQLDIILPIWIGQQMVLAPSFSLSRAGSTFYDYGIGGVFRYYIRRSKAAPFIGVRGVLLVLSPDEGEKITDFVVGGLFGGEYFFDPHFSVAVEGQLNIAVSGNSSFRFANPGETNFNTATGVFATFYF